TCHNAVAAVRLTCRVAWRARWREEPKPLLSGVRAALGDAGRAGRNNDRVLRAGSKSNCLNPQWQRCFRRSRSSYPISSLSDFDSYVHIARIVTLKLTA